MAILNVFGLNWDTDSSLATKQGYIQTLLRAGVSGQEIKDLIASIDPSNANQTVYDILGIPNTFPQPVVTQEPIYTEPVSQPVSQQPVSQQPVTQEVYTPPPAPPTFNVFGLSWNSGASLATKQGYVQSLLAAGITPDQIKSKINEIDPASATQANFDLLGIPKPAPVNVTAPRDAAQEATTLLAAQLGLNLPKEWPYYTPQDKVNWFNANKVTEQTLKDYKVPQADIDAAIKLGLGKSTPPPPTFTLPAGMTLPSNWASFTGQQKVDYYNANKITADMLRAANVPEADVQAAITLGLGKPTTTTPTTPTKTPTTTPTTFNPQDFIPPTYNLPATNFVPFATGGGQTSLAVPTTGFFYKTTPTPEVPFQFQSGAAGYTNLRPMTLEFGVPANVSKVQQFIPGDFNKAGVGTDYGWAKTNEQLTQQAAAQNAKNMSYQNIVDGGFDGGMIVGFKDYEGKPDDDVSYEMGGKIKSLLGPDPMGPDEGYAKLQRGEYVVKKKAVNKYGEEFLKALNEARLPKQKVKSLL